MIAALVLSLFAQTCDGSLWAHVYHKDRLVVLDDCVTVTGRIILLRKEKDGDYHIQLKVDPKYRPLLNKVNRAKQGGNLVLEPVCALKVTQADAIGACRGYENTVTIPKKGDQVKVTGTYVKDTQHGWQELHPLTDLTVLPPARKGTAR